MSCKKQLAIWLFVVTLIGLKPNIYRLYGEPYQSAIIIASADVTISETFPFTNYGSDMYLNAGAYLGNRTRFLLYFDLSTIPPGSNIVSATLHLTFSDCFNCGSYAPIRIYMLTIGFDETCVTWYSSTCIDYWASPGGDYIMPPIATVDVSNKFECDDVAADVKDYVDYVVHGGINNGLIVAADDINGIVSFYSREFGPHGPCASKVNETRPYLEIQYTPPGTTPPPGTT
ncbi:MAG: hypothetical protein DRN81_05175, partial [Thermoproteota archaeon]